MKRNKLFTFVLGMLLFAGAVSAQQSSLSTIDPPGSVLTRAFGINSRGDIVGLYFSADNMTHGFLLTGGQYVTIDAPDSIRTNAIGINSRGQIVGRYDTPDGVAHGYIYTGGQFQSFDHPLAAGFTVATDIAPSGAIVGRYQASDKSFHGFLLTNAQQCVLQTQACDWVTIDHLDADGNPDMGPLGIQGMAINPSGVIAGYYQDTAKVFHAFLLENGVYSTIDPPGSKNTGNSGGVLHVNSDGTVVGYYTGTDNLNHGFIYRNGSFTTYDFPEAWAPNGLAQATCTFGVNAQGDVVGFYVDHMNRSHGFVAPQLAEIGN